MQGYDLIMLIVLGMATIFGAIKGFAWQVASLASIIVSYFVAYRFRYDVAEMIQAKPPWNQFLAMLLLYVGTSFVIWVGFRLISGTIDRVRLKEFDRHLGALFGLAKGLVYCLLITMFATSLLGPKQQAAICQSRSGYYIAQALDNGIGILPKEIHDVVGPYLSRLDNQLKSGASGEVPPEPAFQFPDIALPNLGYPGTGLPGVQPPTMPPTDPPAADWWSSGGISGVETTSPQIYPPLRNDAGAPRPASAFGAPPAAASGLRPSSLGEPQTAQPWSQVLPR